MKTWITSRTGSLALTVLITIGACMALVSAIAAQGLSIRTVAGSLLVLCFFVFTFGGVLFAGRAFLKWPVDETSSHWIWERGFVIGGVLFTVLGLALLQEMLHTAGEAVLSQLGTVAYLFGAVIVVAAETAFLSRRDWVYSRIVLYVVLAFLAQAALGAALLQTSLVAAWVGWATIIWNLAWLPVLLVFSPRNIYYPVLHHAAPLLIGIALLTQR